VSGDTGFKGSWLALWLSKLGAKVVGYALPPVAGGNWDRAGVGECVAHRDGDIRDGAALAAYVRQTRPDVAFHLAAQSLVLEGYASPSETFDVNVQGTVAFLEALRHSSVRAAVIVTTDKCYENRHDASAYRETDMLGGVDPYSASKACAELVTAAYRASFFAGEDATRIATARAGNVIGAGDWGDHRLLPDCMRALRRGEPIHLRQANAVRPWQHVLEPLAGYLMLGAALAGNDGARFAEAWNFGPPAADGVTVGALVAEVIDAWGGGEAIATPVDGAPYEALALTLDAAKAEARLGWRPVLTLKEAIALTVAGYRADLERDDASVRADRLAQIDAFMARAGVGA
jgi:CDP-glucose 4,6-dehydratase